LMTMASMVAVAACISILSFSYCVGSNLQHMLNKMEDSIGISVFLKGELSGEEIEKMKKEIGKIDHVEDVQYISPADALDDLKQDWGADEDIFVGLDEANNPLSHSFQISLDKIENQNGVLTALENVDGIDNVRHGQTETELLMKANRIFGIASVIVMLLLGAISVMIIMNTIRISVVNRRIEINIMKYVGATDWFIRWPFIIEGIIIGVVGAIIPLVIGFPVYAQVTSAIFNYLPMITFVQFKLTGDVFGFLFPFGIIFGIALGGIGSVTSIRKHLRV
ncbi:MAG: permease-like cell division protein FtsX, partial [Anaerotignum sp.]|nr:permease-like cell division protein FtsX [Anaerotignum sp.]